MSPSALSDQQTGTGMGKNMDKAKREFSSPMFVMGEQEVLH